MNGWIFLLLASVGWCAQAENLNPLDVEKFNYYLPQAQAGNARAQADIGLMFVEGIGVAKDKAQGFVWLLKAAEQGEINAQFSVGYLYDTGQGVAENRSKAIEWYRKAAAQGNGSAQNNLGLVYCQRKRGEPYYPEVCYALLSLAAARDRSGMAEALWNESAQRMTTEHIRRGKVLAQDMQKSNNLLAALDEFIKTQTELRQEK